MISKEEKFIPASQSVRVILRDPLGHMVHDMTLPLVVTVEVNGVMEHKPLDIDTIVNEHIALHEERYKAVIAAAKERGHL